MAKKPRLVRNIQDSTDFWHSVVAKNGKDLIIGKDALSMVSPTLNLLACARDRIPSQGCRVNLNLNTFVFTISFCINEYEYFS